MLLVKFELLFCELTEDKDEEETDIMKLIPEPLNTASVSLQNIGVQSITSGLHQYYAVNFDGDHFCSLDTMFHACITNLHYHAIIPPTEIMASLKDQFGNQISDATLTEDSRSTTSDSTAATQSTNNDDLSDAQLATDTSQQMNIAPTPTRRRRVSTTIDSAPNGNTNTGKRSSAINNIFRFIASPEKTLFPLTTSNSNKTTSTSTNNSSSASSTVDDNNNGSRLQRMQESFQSKIRLFKGSSSTSNPTDTANAEAAINTENNAALTNLINSEEFKALSLTPSQALSLFQSYGGPVIVNYHRAINNSQFILDEYVKWKGANEVFQHSCDIPSHNLLHQSSQERICILLHSNEDLDAIFQSTTTWSMEQVEQLILRNIHTCNAILSSRLNIMFNALRRIMKLVRKTMKQGFVLESNSFWKQQMMIHTKK